jgi:hypothetical protein
MVPDVAYVAVLQENTATNTAVTAAAAAAQQTLAATYVVAVLDIE